MREATDCPLCRETGGRLVWRNDELRVVGVEDAPGFPAFYRVIWNTHVAEWSDLTVPERARGMEAVTAVEQVLRHELQPRKINLASLGNVVPHLHWHVIARFEWDSHFPQPIWAAAQRPEDAQRLAALRARWPALDAAIVQALG
jgi:diadenosine tetraphosphate (Ap4A) HIT family hydrolase